MRWIRQGLIYASTGQHGWDRTHAAVPVVDASDTRVWRIYYAARDEHNRSRTGCLEVEADNPARVLSVRPEPILPLGPPGSFDDCGIMPTWILADGARRWLFYIGVTVRQTVPYHNAIGLALSDDEGRTFRKAGAGPLFGSTLTEPYFTGNCCVLREGDRWRVWYLSCVRWDRYASRPEPIYHIKYAESADGILWQRDGVVALELAPHEAGLAKPCVVRHAGGYRMWYCRRGLANYRTDRATSYRLGYAESADGRVWQRRDEQAGLDVAESGWDSEMIAYPHVVETAHQTFLFYNGNGFGRSGFGFATLDTP